MRICTIAFYEEGYGRGSVESRPEITHNTLSQVLPPAGPNNNTQHIQAHRVARRFRRRVRSPLKADRSCCIYSRAHVSRRLERDSRRRIDHSKPEEPRRFLPIAVPYLRATANQLPLSIRELRHQERTHAESKCFLSRGPSGYLSTSASTAKNGL